MPITKNKDLILAVYRVHFYFGTFFAPWNTENYFLKINLWILCVEKAVFSKVKFLSILETLFTCKVPNFVSTTGTDYTKGSIYYINIFIAKFNDLKSDGANRVYKLSKQTIF